MSLFRNLILVFLLIVYSVQAYAFDSQMMVRNTGIYSINAGQCSAVFEFIVNDFLLDVSKLEFTIVARDSKHNVVLADVITASAQNFNMVSGKTFGTFSLEGEEVCSSANWIISMPKVLVVFNDGTPSFDLVKAKKIGFIEFKPYKIVFGK